MKHDINTLSTLNGINSIPDDGHDGTVEGGPPCTENAEGSSVEDGIAAGHMSDQVF